MYTITDIFDTAALAFSLPAINYILWLCYQEIGAVKTAVIRYLSAALITFLHGTMVKISKMLGWFAAPQGNTGVAETNRGTARENALGKSSLGPAPLTDDTTTIPWEGRVAWSGNAVIAVLTLPNTDTGAKLRELILDINKTLDSYLDTIPKPRTDGERARRLEKAMTYLQPMVEVMMNERRRRGLSGQR
jgi:hypothetical protein